jgi:hypothetical protein
MALPAEMVKSKMAGQADQRVSLILVDQQQLLQSFTFNILAGHSAEFFYQLSPRISTIAGIRLRAEFSPDVGSCMNS